MLDQALGEQDPAFAIKSELLGIGKEGGSQRVVFVGEHVIGVDTGAQLFHPLHATALNGGMLEGRKGDNSVKRLPRQDSTKSRRNGYPPLAVDLVDCGRQEQRHLSRTPSFLTRRLQLLRFLGKSANMGFFGISWVSMGRQR